MAKLPPEGLLEQSLEPTALTTWEAFVAALGAVVTGPRTSFRLEPDRRMAQLRADTEAQLDDLVTALHSRHSILAHAGAPRVAYRETIRRKAQVEAAHRVGEGFARVRLGFEPQRRGRGYAFQNRAAARRVPKAMVAWVERGLESARQEGLLDGGPVTDFKAVLLDGDCQGTSSDGEAFEGAARSAFQRLRDVGAPVVLEPVMEVAAKAPVEFAGDIIGDLSSRRSMIRGAAENLKGEIVVMSETPLACLFGYESALRLFTRGLGSAEVTFLRYQEVGGDDDDPDRMFPAAMALRA